MSSGPKYKISMDLQVLNHLGVNLYSNMPAVLSEVTANAWDADAENVKITIEENIRITIEDDGCGMNLQDINDKFLCVGYQKRNEGATTPRHQRKVMGRKGIGKLSLFSIAEIIRIYSVKEGDRNAFEINTIELNKAISLGNREYYPKVIDFGNSVSSSSGTKIVLEGLKKRTQNLSLNLKRRISRRFSIIGDLNQFNVFVNNEKITVEDRDYFRKVQYIWLYGIDEDNIKSQTGTSNFEKITKQENSCLVAEKQESVTGWIATAKEPGDLKGSDGEESINRISVMVRGKLAKEDILGELGETALYSKYVFGEITADFLDVDDAEDIATSNRQGFFEDDERYTALLKFVKKELKLVRSDWTALRNEAGLSEARKIGSINNWYDSLGKDDQRAAKQLFGKINQLEIGTEAREELFRHGIFAFEILRLKSELSKLDKIVVEDVEAFIESAKILSNLEANYFYKIITERLSVIRKMKGYIETGSLEKLVQGLLGNNLWLLDPSWDRVQESNMIEIGVTKALEGNKISLSQEEKDSRFDIYYKKTSLKHIVIELKKPDRILKTNELQSQVGKYHSAIVKFLNENNLNEPFEIIVLIGRPLDKGFLDESTNQVFLDSFAKLNTRVMTYIELVSNAEKMYSDFISKHNEAIELQKRIIGSLKSEEES